MKKKRLLIGIMPVAFLGIATLGWSAALEIKAFQDISGQSRPARYAANGAVTVTCVRAVQSAPVKAGDHQPACYVTGPGLGQQLAINKSAQTSGGGNVTLTCIGSGQLGCSARIAH
jgi:hypothetical protein